MNIFYLHYLAKKCARYHFDKHVVKMILETAQLLSTVWWTLEPEKAETLNNNGHIYKKTHVNHPSAIWARESRSNYEWLTKLGLELCKEYTFRYTKKEEEKRIHKTQSKLEWMQNNIPSIEKLPELGMTKIPQAMPDECKRVSPIDGYRAYYQSEHKIRLAKWTKRKRPSWYSLESNKKIKADL